jgi:Zn ribbon nucleic-acid-binding protein
MKKTDVSISRGTDLQVVCFTRNAGTRPKQSKVMVPIRQRLIAGHSCPSCLLISRGVRSVECDYYYDPTDNEAIAKYVRGSV